MKFLPAWISWPDAILIACVIVGIPLYLSGSRLPLFLDAEQAMTAYSNACSATGPIDGWWRTVDQYRSWREPLVSVGLGLMLLAATLGFLRLAMLFPFRRSALRTPCHSWAFLPIGVGSVALITAGSIWSLVEDQQSFHFPACADSIAIPIGGLMMLTGLLVPIFVLVGLAVQLRFGPLPISLTIWDKSRPLRCWSGLVIFGLPASAMLLLAFISLPTSGIFLIPGEIIAAYLLLSTRAALLSKPTSPLQVN